MERFELDKFQKEAIESAKSNNSVIVSAPTGAGKTLIAEYITEDCINKNKGIIYTAPIKALSNQKFRDFSKKYPQKTCILTGDVSINIPPSDAAWVFINEKKKKGISLYCIQEKVNPASIGSNVIHKLNNPDIRKLVILVVKELKKVWDYNKSNEDIQIGLDGQISNFSVMDYDENNPSISENTKLAYIDTSTPMYRINGEEAMEPELLLKSAPPLIRGLLKILFMQEVVDRYYDFRLVLTDLLANFYKEQLPEIVPLLIEDINGVIKEEMSYLEIEPLTLNKLDSYYKGDKRIWVIFQTMRRFDRFIRAKIFRRRYNFYLPGKIKR